MVDHIYTAVVRAKDNILVKNALLWDIQRFYKEEYQIGKKALEIIEKKTGVLLPNDEAGFIAVQSYGDTSNKKGSDIKGIGVKVGYEPTHAHYYVSDVSAVTALLKGLLALCQS